MAEWRTTASSITASTAVVLIEFDHQCGIVFDNDMPSRIHIHTVVRTPNGNDYGKDLLRQHYERAHAVRHTPSTATSW
jgi:Protein of unknown function (DUF3500)